MWQYKSHSLPNYLNNNLCSSQRLSCKLVNSKFYSLDLKRHKCDQANMLCKFQCSSHIQYCRTNDTSKSWCMFDRWVQHKIRSKSRKLIHSHSKCRYKLNKNRRLGPDRSGKCRQCSTIILHKLSTLGFMQL